MNVVAWILTGLLVLINLGSGAAKLATPREKLLQNPNMAWAADFSAGQVKAIGAVEVLAAIGLVVPWLTGIAPVLTPLAAVGIALLQVGAAATHARRRETKVIPVNVVIIVLAVVVAVIRFGQL